MVHLMPRDERAPRPAAKHEIARTVWGSALLTSPTVTMAMPVYSDLSKMSRRRPSNTHPFVPLPRKSGHSLIVTLDAFGKGNMGAHTNPIDRGSRRELTAKIVIDKLAGD
eukprot:jgi/Tetstr1/458191/TSEL_044682.t1